MIIRQQSFSLILVFLTITMIVLACSSSAGEACIATVTYQGKAFEGKDKEPEKAKLNACNNYCRDADPEFDARYHIWLESPKGKSTGSPSKQESIFKDVDLMKYVTETCSNKCVAEMKPEAKCN